jgi:acyl transferase domain-containing protein/acyl carrier protein
MTTTSDRIVEALRTSLTDNERLRRELQRLTAASAEPVAIVGMACRFPGGADSPRALWELVERDGDAIGDLPTDRGWDLEALHRPDPARPAGVHVPRGGFVYEAAEFDPAFFGISPREALAMDPQQRLLLQTSWETFERAGIDPGTLRGSRTGVFVGASHNGYGDGVEELPEGVATYSVTGISSSVTSGRLSYVYGLEGPAVTVDTACSSALVALHLAVRALRNGECSLALAGGAAVMSVPGPFLGFSGVGVMAEDNRCKAFAAAADGTGFAEGAGLVLLERLSDAQRAGHRVLAVIRGSAVNQDGASSGLTAPNGPSQQRVIRAALADARLTASDVDAVEAHGTGTRLGDPIEAQALVATYGQAHTAERPLWLGSVKSNLGHTQAAAGVAGVIKMVMALRHGLLPRTLHVDEPTPLVDWSDGGVALLTEPVPWPAGDRPRRAGVSSFGISGTNAHVILEEAPEPPTQPESDSAESRPALLSTDRAPAVPWLVSGRSEKGLRAQGARLAAHVRSEPDLDVTDVGWSLATSRAALGHRAVVVGGDTGELLAGTDALADGVPAGNLVAGITGDPRVVFVFPGQGSQWAGMAIELLAASPVFAARIAECEAALAPWLDWSLTAVLRQEPGAPELERIDVVQPVLWAMMISLAALWRAAGVEPVAVVGHSQGEIAAACVAGGLSLADAAKVIALRSQAFRALSGQGGLLSVALPPARVEELVAPYGGRAWVAALNGPSAAVVSGANDALDALAATCAELGVQARRIASDVPSHGPAVQAIREEIFTGLADLAPRSGTIPFWSTVTGEVVDTARLDAAYWYENLCNPVRFGPVVTDLARDGVGVFVELSPHPVLAVAVGDCVDEARAGAGTDLDGAGPAVVGTLRRGDGGAGRFLLSLGEAWTRGAGVAWDRVFPAGARTVELSTYPFARERFWLTSARSWAAGANRPAAGTRAADEHDAVLWDAIERGDAAAFSALLGFDLDGRGVGERGMDDRGMNNRGADEDEQDDLAGDGPSGVEGVLAALRTWRERRRRQDEIDGWRYRVGWVPVGPAREPVLRGSWLLVVPQASGSVRPADAGYLDADEVAAWQAGLARCGAEVSVLAVDPAGTSSTELADRLRGITPAPAGVLSLLAADDREHPDGAGVPCGLAGTAALVRALLDVGGTGRLWCVTRGAVSVTAGEYASSPAQAQLWGLGRVVALEQPQLWGGLVDVPVEPVTDRVLERVAGVLAGAGEEDQLAVRGSGVLARRLVPAPLGAAAAGTVWRPRGTVLVTGGTGALGAHVARWLARNGARHLILTSRRGIEAAGAADLVTELTGLGVSVRVAACDAADADQLRALLAELPEDQPLTGVVHAAGVGRAGTVDTLDVAELAEVGAPKVVGVAALEEVVEEVLARRSDGADLDAFVLFSSNAGVWGSGGQAAYAAANAALDAVAERRRARGRTATSIAWGAWGGGEGMLADAAVRRMLELRGLLEMPPELAMEALAQAVGHQEVTVSVAAMDWPRFAPSFTARRPSPLLADLPQLRAADTGPAVQATESGPSEGEAAAGLRARVAAALPRERHELLTEVVREQVAGVLGHAVDAVEPRTALRDLGLDSIVAVDLRNRLSRLTGLRLPASLAFDHPTPAALARSLETALTALAAAGPSGSAPTASAPALAPASEAPAPDQASAQPRAAVVTSPSDQATALVPAENPTRTPSAPPDLAEDPVVIVGMACRLPGGVDTPDKLWQVVSEGVDAVGPAPTDRGWESLDLARILAAPEEIRFLEEGGFLHGVGDFDPEFFGIEPPEATAMDPQQRLLLEMAWEALERSGLAGRGLRGSSTGVFVGTYFQGYASTNRQPAKALRPYLAGGSAPAIASGRLAFALGLEGPTFTIDTGCSSSAVALHLGSRAVASGECEAALVGGVTVLSHPVAFTTLGGGAAPDGRCKPFSSDADGTGWGEGAGMLVLERLSRARREGHPVLAVVRGSAVNHDGATTGLTDPSAVSQERVLRAALAAAGVPAASVDVVEAHGTGTSLGDAVEAEALLRVYGEQRSPEHPLRLGTVKSNIGHPQAASGVVGVIKTVLSLQHDRLPAMIERGAPTRLVDWSSGAIELLTRDVPWPRGTRPRRAAVSSFGGSGTKVHVILEEAPAPEPVAAPAPAPTAELPCVVSGRSEAALRAQAGQLAAFLRDPRGDGGPDVGALAEALARRSAFAHRAVVFAGDGDALASGLAAVQAGAAGPEVVHGTVEEASDDAPSQVLLGFVFPAGTTAGTVPAVGADEAHRAFAAFAEVWDQVWARVGLSVAGLAPERAALALAEGRAFAEQAALVALAERSGLRPQAAVVSGVGALAAACAAGLWRIEDAVAVLAARHAPDPGALERAVASLGWAVPAFPLIDGSTGESLTPERLCSAGFWAAGDEPDQAGADLARLLGLTAVLPMTLAGLAESAAPAERASMVSVWWRAVAQAFVRGVDVDWSALLAAAGVQAGAAAVLPALPTYAFQRERYWLASGDVGRARGAAAPERAAVDDRARKEVVLEYFRRLNEGDVDRVLELFAPEAVIEDPVGSVPRQGAEALREYYEITLEQGRCEVTVGTAVGAQDGTSVAVPVTGRLIALQDPERRRVSIECVDIFGVDDEGRIEDLRVYWGMTDYSF